MIRVPRIFWIQGGPRESRRLWIGFLLEKTAAAIRMEVIVPLRTRPFLPPDFEEIERTVSTQDQYKNIFERHQNGPDVRRGSINLSITQDRNSKFYSNE